jgi:hypothetical protein
MFDADTELSPRMTLTAEGFLVCRDEVTHHAITKIAFATAGVQHAADLEVANASDGHWGLPGSAGLSSFA